MTRSGLHLLLAIVAFGACERDVVPIDKRLLVAPDPVNKTPVELAHEKFEVIPGDFAIGTSKLYSRGDFFADPYGTEAFDQGGDRLRDHRLRGE